MRPPAFWDGPPDHPAALALGPLGALYGRLTAARMDRPGRRGPCPVLCLGNFTLGGAGKTPAALALAEILRALGRRPAFLSRGYGGHLPGPVRVDPAAHGFAEVGDEPLLLARDAPTVVSRDRVAGSALCAASGADAVVMDDGLQNPGLAKDLVLCVVDGGSGVGNGRVFPAGPLRAPLVRQWPHIAGLILVGSGEAGERVGVEALARGLSVHRAALEPRGAEFAGRRVLAFAGIGRPQKFFASLAACGAQLVGTRSFADHHAYGPRDLATLDAEAARLGAALVTTEKDAVRLPAGFPARTLPVRLRFADPAAVRAQVAAALAP